MEKFEFMAKTLKCFMIHQLHPSIAPLSLLPQFNILLLKLEEFYCPKNEKFLINYIIKDKLFNFTSNKKPPKVKTVP